MKEEEKSICWLGVIPECDKDKVRYPTEEEIDKALEELEEMEEEDWDEHK
tara:strand:+ start:112 stop:261 length:150 start_codon:yes stop_codon:yes gene_type:complete